METSIETGGQKPGVKLAGKRAVRSTAKLVEEAETLLKERRARLMEEQHRRMEAIIRTSERDPNESLEDILDRLENEQSE